MFISNICLIFQIFRKEFRRPLSGPAALSQRAGLSPARRAPTGRAAGPARRRAPHASTRECEQGLGTFPWHSFLISVCVSAGILLLSNALQFGSISAWPRPRCSSWRPPARAAPPAATAPGRRRARRYVLQACTYTHTRTHRHFFECQSSPIPGVFVRRRGPCLTSLKINNLQLFRRNIWLIFPFHVL